MKKRSLFIPMVVVVASLVLVSLVAAADLNPAHIGSECPGGGLGTWHFVNNQTDGAGPGLLTVTFDDGHNHVIGPTSVNRNTQHFYIDHAGTLVAASTNLPGSLVLSDLACASVPVDYSFNISGVVFKDFGQDGPSAGDPIRPLGTIHITGSGFQGEAINESIDTPDGYWSFGKSYSLSSTDPVVSADLNICFTPDPGQIQTYPAGCYHVILAPANPATQTGLDFGVWLAP